MRTFKLSIVYLTMLTFIFTSCNNEEVVSNDPDSQMATLSFETLLNDLETTRSVNKAHLDFLEDVPDCSDDEPNYVEIVLTQDNENVLGEEGDPFRIDLVDGETFTEEVPELELLPGNYTLDHFAVYNEEGDLIWLSPREAELGEALENSLPLSIDLRSGVKKYVEVDVLCFDDRFVNEYGYLFFELNATRTIEFCIFGNYCGEDGRHYPAEYTVSIWDYEDGEIGNQWYENVPNTFEMNEDGDYAAEPICFALPDTAGEDEYYFEITLKNSDAYEDIDEGIIRSGVITDEDVRALFDGEENVDYYHFREGNCGDMGDIPEYFEDDPGNGECDPQNLDDDCDEDGIANGQDNCPEIANAGQGDLDEDGIGDACDSDIDGDDILNENENEGCIRNPDPDCGTTAVVPCLPEADDDCLATEVTNINLTTTGPVISNLFYGDWTIQLVEGGLFVGLTPVIPYEISDIEVITLQNATCGTAVPEEGGAVTIEGITEDDLPLSINVRANICDVSGEPQ